MALVKTPLLGGSSVTRSSNADDNRAVNILPEIIPDGGKEPAFMFRAPGLRRLATIGLGPIRGLWQFGAFLYVVSGTRLYRVSSTYSASLLGNVSGTGPVSMADNGTQLFIACNPNGYIYNSTTGALQQITDPDFPGAQMVGYIDGFFVFNQPGTQLFWITSLLDGTAVDPLDFASAEGFPDDIVSLIVDHREIWLFGTTTTEVWYNAGPPDFPFARIDGAFNEMGCAAAYSVAKMDNQIYWLGKDARGQGIVYRAQGYIAQRVSTHAVEWRIQQYPDLSNAIGYTCQFQGHTVYRLIFPDQPTGWQFDVATNAWTEFAAWDTGAGAWKRHRSNCQATFNGLVVVGDYEDGNLYQLDPNAYSDNGEPQRWMRSWRALPTGQNNLTRTAHHSLQLDCETGVGLSLGQGSDPQVALRWSDDGGHSWSNEHWASMGRIGEYGRRCIWRRLGMTLKLRDRVLEISGTDPVPITLNGAILDLTGAAS